MTVPTEIRPADELLPAFDFHWDAETEILAGRCAVAAGRRGFTGSVELESPEGAVLLLEAEGGVLSGVEVVVWPDPQRPSRLVAPHDAAPGRVVLLPPGPSARLVEIDAPIAVATPPNETLVHLTFGGQRARTVRVAPNVLVEVDAHDRLVGLWLLDLPPFPDAG